MTKRRTRRSLSQPQGRLPVADDQLQGVDVEIEDFKNLKAMMTKVDSNALRAAFAEFMAEQSRGSNLQDPAELPIPKRARVKLEPQQSRAQEDDNTGDTCNNDNDSIVVSSESSSSDNNDDDDDEEPTPSSSFIVAQPGLRMPHSNAALTSPQMLATPPQMLSAAPLSTPPTPTKGVIVISRNATATEIAVRTVVGSSFAWREELRGEFPLMWNRDSKEWRLATNDGGQSFVEHAKRVCESHQFELRLEFADDQESRTISAILSHATEILGEARRLAEARARKHL